MAAACFGVNIGSYRKDYLTLVPRNYYCYTPLTSIENFKVQPMSTYETVLVTDGFFSRSPRKFEDDDIIIA